MASLILRLTCVTFFLAPQDGEIKSVMWGKAHFSVWFFVCSVLDIRCATTRQKAEQSFEILFFFNQKKLNMEKTYDLLWSAKVLFEKRKCYIFHVKNGWQNLELIKQLHIEWSSFFHQTKTFLWKWLWKQRRVKILTIFFQLFCKRKNKICSSRNTKNHTQIWFVGVAHNLPRVISLKLQVRIINEIQTKDSETILQRFPL